MLVSCALIAGIAALGRYLTLEGVPPLQVVFLRCLFALVFMLPLLAIRGADLVRTTQMKTYTVRVCVGLVAMITWFTALSLVPVGELTAISFLSPIFATVFAVVFLREIVRLRRWLATAAGFLGALVILRPGMVEMAPGIWIAIAAAVTMGLSTMFIKRLTGGDDPDRVVFISTAMMTPAMLLPALYVWQWPEAHVWPWLLALGPLATLGHVALARAFSAADASIVMSFDFARLPFAVLYGFLAFGELIDLWTWAGAAIIFAASLYTARRELMLRRAQTAGVTAPTHGGNR